MKNRIAATALALAALAPALSHPGVLYKYVDANGTITFSDTPPSGARILEERPLGATSGTLQVTSGPISNAFVDAEQMLGFDPEVARANASVDLAERELAAARRELCPLYEGVRLRPTRLSLDDDARLEPYRKNLKIARQQLAEILRDRRFALR
ncbi:MAG: DUF4124 domain-containing protein [Usitatibacter sp.]